MFLARTQVSVILEQEVMLSKTYVRIINFDVKFDSNLFYLRNVKINENDDFSFGFCFWVG